jgi:hypothetical protein
VGAAYAWLLTELSGPTPVVRWVVTIGSILVAGLLVDALAVKVRVRANSTLSRSYVRRGAMFSCTALAR